MEKVDLSQSANPFIRKAYAFISLVDGYLGSKNRVKFLKDNYTEASSFVKTLQKNSDTISEYLSHMLLALTDSLLEQGVYSEVRLKILAKNIEAEGQTNSYETLSSFIGVLEQRAKETGLLDEEFKLCESYGNTYSEMLSEGLKALKPETYKLLSLSIACFLKELPHSGSKLLSMTLFQFLMDITELKNEIRTFEFEETRRKENAKAGQKGVQKRHGPSRKTKEFAITLREQSIANGTFKNDSRLADKITPEVMKYGISVGFSFISEYQARSQIYKWLRAYAKQSKN